MNVNSTNFYKSSQVTVSNIAQKFLKLLQMGDRMKSCKSLGCNSEYFWRYSLSDFLFYMALGVRSLANASRARQFNPLNPPGVGWVNFFFKVRVSIRTCMQNLGAVSRERFLTIYNPLNPTGGRVGQIFNLF